MKGPRITRDEMLQIPARERSDPALLAMEPVVSVLVITYNHEAFIEQCLQGILAQKVGFPIEVIIGEDQSKDRTLGILLDYQRTHPHLLRIVTSDENVGFNANFLRIFGRARGKYLALCEGDDYWTDPDKLSKQVDVMERFPETVLCGARTHQIGPQEQNRGEWLPERRPFLYRTHYTMEDLLSAYRPHTSTFVLRSAGFEIPECGFTIFGLDLLLVTSSVLQGEVRCLPDFVSAYRIHSGGVYSGITRLRQAEHSVVWHETILGIVDAEHERLWQKLVTDARFGLCDELTQAGDFVRARALAFELLGSLQPHQWKQKLHCWLVAYTPWAYRPFLKAKGRISIALTAARNAA